MNSRSVNIAILTTSLLISSTAFADTKFRPRATVGIADYNIDLKSPGNPTATSKATYLKAGFGATVINNRWYFDLAYDGSINAEADDDGDKLDFTRDDLTLTAGYVFPNNATVFGGYKTGNSEFKAQDTSGFQFDFEAKGIYAGGGMNFPSGNNVFSINAAIAFLDGELTITDPTDPVLPSITLTSDTVGISLGAGYNIPINNTSGFALKASYQSYEFDNFEFAGFSSDLSAEESIFTVNASYYSTF